MNQTPILTTLISSGLDVHLARVFPKSDLATLGISVANALRDVLEQGDSLSDVPGLNEAPVFLNRDGAGGGRDETLTTTATVRFFDDEESGVPEVVIVGIAATGERANYGDDLWSQECVASLDCNTNQFQPGARSVGVNSATAGALLFGAVDALMRDEPAMIRAGFTNPRVTPGSSPSAMGKDGLPMEFHAPLTVTFEIYISKT